MSFCKTRAKRAALIKLLAGSGAVALATLVSVPANAAVTPGLTMKTWNNIPYIDYYPTSSTIDQEVAYTNATTPDSMGVYGVSDAFYYSYYVPVLEAVNFSGFLNITVAGNYTFYVDVDDAARITLDGNTLLEGNFYQGPAAVATYLDVGAHSYNAFYFQTGGGSYFETYIYDGPANATFTTDVSSPVPEPATWAMMTLGFGALGFAMRRKHKVATRINFA